jgi:hypothetical protein
MQIITSRQKYHECVSHDCGISQYTSSGATFYDGNHRRAYYIHHHHHTHNSSLPSSLYPFFLPVLLLLQHHPRNTSLSPLLTIIDTPPCCWRPYYFETMEDNTNKKVLGIYCHQCGSDSWVNIGEVMGFPYMRCESLHCIETRNPDFCSFCSLRDCRIDNISQQKVRSHNSQCHETSQKRRCLSLPLPSESRKSDSPNGSKSDVTVQQQPMMGADDILEYDNDHDTLVKDVEEGSNYNDDGGDDDVVIVGGGIADYWG